MKKLVDKESQSNWPLLSLKLKAAIAVMLSDRLGREVHYRYYQARHVLLAFRMLRQQGVPIKSALGFAISQFAFLVQSEMLGEQRPVIIRAFQSLRDISLLDGLPNMQMQLWELTNAAEGRERYRDTIH